MCVMFTSGSTGEPKGVALEHRAVATSCYHHGSRFGFDQTTRNFQFANYIFDPSLSEIFATLMFGGCICVPSDEERSGDISAAMSRMDITFLEATPTVAKLIEPRDHPNLKGIMLAGESTTSDNFERWLQNPATKVFHGFGPTECAILCLLGEYDVNQPNPRRIGQAVGCAAWIVDPQDVQKLVPIGSIGELLIEGPILARGYLGDMERTNAAFIDAPAWLLQGGRSGKLYKTGDLVSYGEDGSIHFVGRKDTQFKIRGQRVELGEVEHQVSKAFPDAQQVAAEVIVPSGGDDTTVELAAFVVLQKDANSFDNWARKYPELKDDTTTTCFAVRVPNLLEDQLAELLPRHMIPTSFFIMGDLPRSATGKTDRKQLKKIGSLFSVAQLVELRNTSKGCNKRMPKTETEVTLQHVIARTLNIDLSVIGLDDSFYRLGGDSITSMQVSSAARSRGINISTSHILRQKTIARILETAGPSAGHDQTATAVKHVDIAPGQAFPLTPVQRLYLDLQKDLPLDQIIFDQYFWLKPRSHVAYPALVQAFSDLASAHSMLRARLRKTSSGQWEQFLIASSSEAISVKHCKSIDEGQISQEIKTCRARIDIENGPAVSAILFDNENGSQIIFLCIHHLVIDLVSWRVLLGDLEELLSGRSLPTLAGISFPTWATLQDNYIKSHHSLEDLQSPPHGPSDFSYWGIKGKTSLTTDVINQEFRLDAATTSMLLGQCNEALGTRPSELMIAALLYSFTLIFTDRDPPTVFNEGHGREVWDESLEISRTVGWFTTIHPVHLEQQKQTMGLLDIIKRVKDSIRKVPHKGWKFFSSQFVNEQSVLSFESQFCLELVFNFGGLYQQMEREDAFFQNVTPPSMDCTPETSVGARRFSLFEVNTSVTRGELGLSLFFDRRISQQEKVSDWITQFQSTLVDIAKDFPHMDPGWTLDDFPSAFNSYDAISEFKEEIVPRLGLQFDDVEDIFPCSPMQEGILMSQAKNPSHYQTRMELHLSTGRKGRSIDLTKIEEAWRDVVKRHQLLRAVILDSFPGSTRSMLLIIKDPSPTIRRKDNITGPHSQTESSPAAYGMGDLRHTMAITRISDSEARLIVDMDHTITDAHSRGILIKDLQAAYGSTLSTEAPSFGSFITHLNQWPVEEGLSYWKSYLSETEPCYFPAMGSGDDALINQEAEISLKVEGIDTDLLRKVCSDLEVTLAAIIQAAWAVVLGQFSSSTVPSFGMLTSGRDSDLKGIDDIFGPLIGILPCRVDTRSSMSIAESLKKIQADYLDALPYQGVPLAGIHNAIGLGTMPLFNTIVSMQRADKTSSKESPSDLDVTVLGGKDPTEYDISIQAVDDGSNINVSIVGRRSVLGAFGPRISRHLGTAICTILQSPSKAFNTIDLFGDMDKDEVWAMNHLVPESNNICVHDMIAETVRMQPHSPAIDAWDGSITYDELNSLATNLSHRLKASGVSSGCIVPICLEKSMWTAVATLAVLKAGGAFVLLDASLPHSRLRSIVDQTETAVLLASPDTKLLVESLASTIILVGDHDDVAQPSGQTVGNETAISQTQPSDTLYVVFTSGTTGVPKGVVVSHRAFASAILHQAKRLQFNPSARVFDYASYAFDVSINNILMTLATGGCLCVPSDTSRKDDLMGAIMASRANLLHLTPTVSRLLNPKALPDVKTLLLGGETLGQEEAGRWSSVRLINTYGPAECTPTSTINDRGGESEQLVRIGKGVGTVTWVVDINDDTRLAPFGVVGELVIEGPLVGPGYLGNDEATRASFIADPSWLTEGAPGHEGRRGRVYKTGDLVRYNIDGSLTYVNRKDSQVKIRGQRVELSEIEYHVSTCYPEALQVAVDVVSLAGQNSGSHLAAFVVLRSGGGDQSGSARLLEVPQSLNESLEERLPGYMVPSIYIQLDALPLSASAKTDHRRLKAIAESIPMADLVRLRSAPLDGQFDRLSEPERVLQSIWAKILNMDAGMIAMTESFFRLGGDSITAMQVSSSARSNGLDISTAQILRHKTIRRILDGLAIVADPVNVASVASQVTIVPNQPFPLSPIMQLYFDLQHDPLVPFDQNLLLKLKRRVPHLDIIKALESLVSRHTMLRARFKPNSTGKWESTITDKVNEAISVRHVTNVDPDAVPQLIRQCRESLDIQQGPLVAALFLESESSQQIFLSCHHLVVDLVSWRAIMSDLEVLLSLSGDSLGSLSSLSFPVWTTLQTEYITRNTKADSDLIQLFKSRPKSYWGLETDLFLHEFSQDRTFTLGERTSSAILGEQCNNAFNTRPIELLIAALLYSFGKVFNDRDLPILFNEGHGRESWDESLDITSTVGWFTTMFPVGISSGSSLNLLDIIRKTKDHVQSHASNGWKSFVSNFSTPESASNFASLFPVEVLFNYAGVQQRPGEDGALFEKIPVPANSQPEAMKGYARTALIEVLVQTVKDCISVTFVTDGRISGTRSDQLACWFGQYEKILVEIENNLGDRTPELTLVDFPSAFSTYEDIQSFQQGLIPKLGIEVSDIEDIFPCSPMQEGILMSQAKDAGAYQTQLKMHFSTSTKPLDTDVLQEAWHSVVRRHALLRAVLVDNFPGSKKTTHIILKNPTVEMDVLEDATMATSFPSAQESFGLLQHHLSISQVSDKEANLFLTISHTILDAHSRNLLMRDLETAYSSRLPASPASFHRFTDYIEQQSLGDSLRHWATYLDQVEPCQFPTLKYNHSKTDTRERLITTLDTIALRNFCETMETTPATLIQLAWTLVLKQFTGSVTPCFGVISSGRDLPIDGVEDIFGPLVGLLACRVPLKEEITIADVLASIQDDMLKSMDHQTVPIASIHNKLGLGTSALFNSVISLQKVQEEPQSRDREVNVRMIDGDDNTDYDVCIQVTDRNSAIEVAITSPTDILGSCGHQVADMLGVAISVIVQSKPESSLSDLDLLNNQQIQQIRTWNSQVPQPISQCLHTSFQEQVSLRPEKPAVDAWDGKFTYEELDLLSTQLAFYIMSMGVQPNGKIPILFEKSRWAVVAMLAILKTGSAFIPLDPTQAPERRLGILKQLNADIVLASESFQAETLSPECHIINVGPDSAYMGFEPPTREDLPTPNPESLAYILFTSGSTGTPKGVLIQHSAVSSSCFYHGKVMGFNADTRTLQFSSFTFDPSILEIFTTLTFGGCVCMLPDEDRLGYKDDSLRKLGITLMAITTSVARLIQPSEVPNLTTLLISGEVSKPEDFNRWAHLPHLFHGYGPTEASILCVIGRIDFAVGNFKAIGQGVGCNTWVVGANDFHKLLPIGSIGELLVQGPILARGYLNNQEQTDAVFVQRPRWASRLGLSDDCRFYRTGDLVRLGDDGNLIYIARKDNQVKIRGQRVELNEIEHHVLACIPDAQHVAVEIIKPAGVSGRSELAAFVVSGDNQPTMGMDSQDTPKPRLLLLPPAVEKELATRIPGYMIPTLIVSLEWLPLGTTGKIDRRVLRSLGSSITEAELSALSSTTHGSKRAPSTKQESVLQRIWSHILKVDAVQIGVDDSFFRLGGDSIRAMEVSSAARAAGIDISTRHILQDKTITNILNAISELEPSSSEISDVMISPGDRFPLSPMQQLYLNYQHNPGMAFDQTVFLKVHTLLSHQLLSDGLEKLVSLHPVLQARFRRESSHGWEQYLAKERGNAFILKTITEFETGNRSNIIAETRDCLDIEEGPLLAAVLFETSQELFISIHHLAVDLVSWTILIPDLERILGGSMPEQPQVSFPVWATIQNDYAVSNLALDDLQPIEPMLSYWCDDFEPCKTQVVKSFELSEEISQALLGHCNDPFQTQPLELLLASLFYSFSATFPDRPIPSIWNEGHGREPWDDRIDLGRTVGWFTTLYPAQITMDRRESLSIWDAIRMTKDGMRSISRNGWAFFTSQFANSDSSRRFTSSFPVEIMFNYSSWPGKQRFEKPDTMFSTLPLPPGCESQTALDFRKFALFNIFVQNIDGRMTCNFSFDASLQHQDRILDWLGLYEATLKDLTLKLPSRQLEWTLADFPSVLTTYKDIDDFNKHLLPKLGGVGLDGIEEIFPCSPLQQGIFLAQAKNPDMYRTTNVFRFSTAATGARVDINKLQRSWRTVVRQHSLLRTVFFHEFPGASRTMHVVLRDPEPIITLQNQGVNATEVTHVTGYEGAEAFLEHHLFIIPESDTEVKLILKMNHAITDAFSREILLNDLTKAYLGESLTTKQTSFSRFISLIDKESPETALSYWTEYLKEIDPCHFSVLADGDASGKDQQKTMIQVTDIDSEAVRALCVEFELTPAVVCQTAWALVLRQFTGSSTCPCFGVVTSGRDLPIPGIDSIFGPFISMLPMRVSLDGEKDVVETLKTAQRDYIEGSSHQSVSLASIQNALGLEGASLFNSAMSFRRIEKKELGNSRSQMISVIGGEDPTEYDVNVHVTDDGSNLSIMIEAPERTIMAHGDRIVNSFSSALSAIVSSPHAPIVDLSLLDDNERTKLWLLNQDVPDGIDPRIHEILQQKAQEPPGADPKRIEIPTGCNIWVVDEKNDQVLLPFGSVGELLIEGPILADQAQTNTAFIENPKWLLHGAPGIPGRTGRLYKTGDLGILHQDGSLSYVGRKDDQVKIRGQRVQLGQVELVLKSCLPLASEVVVEAVQFSGENTALRLAAFVTLISKNEDTAKLSQKTSPRIFSFPVDVENDMAKKLPAYKIPTIYWEMDQMPRSSSGKTDRKALRSMASATSASLVAASRTVKREPMTESERILRDAWGDALNIDPSTISLDDSFFRLGGDSITAMRVSSNARTQGLWVAVAQILREKTISRILASHEDNEKSSSAVTLPPELVAGQSFPLSPIQNLYFSTQIDPRISFDQAFFLKLKKRVSHEELYDALKTLIVKHPVLHTRFREASPGLWEQILSDDLDASFFVQYEKSVEGTGASPLVASAREKLDIEKGPLLSSMLIDEGENIAQRLFISVHHLVVDLVSWRVLLQQLEELLIHGGSPIQYSLGFPSWTRMQRSYALEHLDSKYDFPFTPSSPLLSYWGLDTNHATSTMPSTLDFLLNETITSAILGACNDAFQTQPMELMISALMYSFSKAFPDRGVPAIFNESHGREVWDDSIDISQTVGWFTTLYPIQLSVDNDCGDIPEFVRRTKDVMRSIPRNGWDYFTSCLSTPDKTKAFISQLPSEITFNYAGMYQQMEQKEALFESIPLPEGSNPSSLAKYQRSSLFDVLVQARNGQLHVMMVYDEALLHQDGIKSWMNHYEHTLTTIGSEFGTRAVEWTLADFPGVFESYSEMDQFAQTTLSNLEILPQEVEDVFPCATIQEGMLVSQMKNPENYRTTFEVELSTAHDGIPLELERVRDAWRDVVKKHSLLRAVIVEGCSRGHSHVHVVLKDPVPDVEIQDISGTRVELLNQIDNKADKSMPTTKLQHRLLIIRQSLTAARLVFEMNHAITDAHSKSIIINDLRAAFEGSLDRRCPSYKDFISYIGRASHDEGLAHWRSYLANVEPCLFPRLAQSCADTKEIAIEVPDIDTRQLRRFCAENEVTPATVLQLAWAAVLSLYTGSACPSFGVLSSGRDVPVDGVNDIFGPFISMLPCKAPQTSDTTLKILLQELQKDYLQGLSHQAVSLAEIHNLLGLGASSLFNSVVTLQKVVKGTDAESSAVKVDSLSGEDPTEYDIWIQAIDSDEAFQVILVSRSDFLGSESSRVASSLSKALSGIISNAHSTLSNLNCLSEQDRRCIWAWNKTLPDTAKTSVRDLIEDKALEQPDRPAIDSWDGKFTYAELDSEASSLSMKLLQSGAEKGSLVPVFSDKSRWAIVALLAIMKMGATFVLLDTALPTQRLHTMLDKIRSPILLATESTLSRAQSMADKIVLVGATSSLSDHVTVQQRRTADPASSLYVVFTSGTTGEPKGVVVSDRSFASAIQHQTQLMGYCGSSRVFDFASYAFDVSINNILFTLTAGGCLCIPSEDDRKNRLTHSINSFGTNFIDLTPAVSRLIDPSEVPGVKTLILGGETLTSNDVSRWPAHVRVINTYGPAECTPTSTIFNLDNHRHDEDIVIGTGAGAVTWIVNPDNHEILTPVGTPGELLIEGPINDGNGYLSNPQATDMVFINDPSWLVQGDGDKYPGRRGRLYKTGDLVRYNKDGELHFLGRKDQQIKIRGQRVELGEIEQQVLQCFADAVESAVDVITPVGASNSQQLAAFVVLRISDGITPRLISVPGETTKQLSEALPAYMCPNLFIALDSLPLNISGKTDRAQLKRIGSSFTATQIHDFSNDASSIKQQPTNYTETALQTIWATLLNLNFASVGIHDHFFKLGGDSIMAMRLVVEARRGGFNISVAEVFQHPTLQDQAKRLLTIGSKAIEGISPFSLIQDQEKISEYKQQASTACAVQSEEIQDIYPCSPLQQGLLALTSKRHGDYVLQQAMELEQNIDLDQLREAWNHAVYLSPILRTRVVQLTFGLFQVVLNNKVTWYTADGLERYLQEDKKRPMGLGEPLTRLAIIHEPKTGVKWFVWTIHHALYDGVSMQLLNDLVYQLQHKRSPKPQLGYNMFIKYLQESDSDVSAAFWKQTLSGFEEEPFPLIPRAIQGANSSSTVTSNCKLPSVLPRGSTKASMVNAAWALTVSDYTRSQDIVFGSVISGRNASVPAIETMVGPTIATVPFRVKISPGDSISSYLEKIQSQSAASIPHEQMGLQNISRLSEYTQRACQFNTLVVVQPRDNSDTATSPFGTWRALTGSDDAFTTYALTLLCEMTEDGFDLVAKFDPRVIQDWHIEGMLDRFAFVFSQLATNDPLQSLSEIDILSPRQLEQVWSFNSTLPPRQDLCIQEMFQSNASKHPDVLAIDAWDGRLTYEELDEVTTIVASQLIRAGVVPEDKVPLFFEKSIWAPVSMLAVMKAGAAFVALDPTQAPERRNEILNQLGSSLVLTSVQHASVPYGDGLSVLAISVETIRTYANVPTAQLPSPDSHAPIYVIFTSGSTGLPKGVVLDNAAISTSCMAHGERLFYEPGLRVLQFASYTFDASMVEILTSFCFASTIVIPSGEDLRNNLQVTVRASDPGMMLLTPTVAKLLSPSDVPNIKTLALGGESMTQEDVEKWACVENLCHAYGPTECGIIATISNIGQSTDIVEIGTSVGCCCWVVDPQDSNRLLPPGVVGELLVEGHTLARGYLGDKSRTEEVFISSPQWLQDGSFDRPGRHSTLYKTGDLVYSNQHGSLVFKGRKDNQAKLRGQRLELGEVEHHLLIAIDDVQQVTVEVIRPSGPGGKEELAAFLVFKEHHRKQDTEQDDEENVISIGGEVEDALANVLPRYMIPTVFFKLSYLPVTSSAKTDRKKLREIGSSFSAADIIQLRSVKTEERRMPSTDKELTMQELWARILNVDAKSIGLDDTFTSLGGDSITAMQVSAAALANGFKVSTSRILMERTISRILEAREITQTPNLDLDGFTEDPGQLFPLSPIQQFYFKLIHDPAVTFDQCFHFELAHYVPFETVEKAFRAMLQTHSIFRARYKKTNDGVKQYFSHDLNDSLFISRHTGKDAEEKDRIIEESRSCVNIETGPLIGVVLFENGSTQTLFISIHHLAVDMMSWRIILGELELLLNGRKVTPSNSLSFPAWSTLQSKYASTHLHKRFETLFPAPMSYWGLNQDIRLNMACTNTKTFTVEGKAAEMLLNKHNDDTGARPLEVLLASMLYSFNSIFTDRPLPIVFNESHGRQTWDESLDISRTVGWFTTMYPVHIEESTPDFNSILQKTSDSIRSFDRNGWDYFTSSFSSPERADAFVSQFPVEIIFNYYGQFQQLEREDSLFKSLPVANPPAIDRFALFDVSVHAMQGCVSVTVEYDSRMCYQDKILAWLEAYEATLRSLLS
ncbi:hypothetical protein ACHAQK_007509 [Fusarium lateritium]